ncbi:MAG: hypothetical protein HYT11_01925 [Candidatus Levybacteria bacterium]|nr:hypothetical protein [Candidatus Levybacteria bacterium]
MSLFQVFLIIGTENKQFEKVQKIVSVYSQDLKKPSVDLFIIEPAKSQTFAKETHISISQIRALKKHLFQKPIASKKKIVIIKKAQLLTREAQNALLKILEEPPAHAIIIMLASDEKLLLSTITSRVITVRVGHDKKIGKPSPLLSKDKAVLLQQIAKIENPEEWLDEQLLSLYQTFISKVQSKNFSGLNQIADLMERIAETKKLIGANVLGRFAIFDLIFSTSRL